MVASTGGNKAGGPDRLREMLTSVPNLSDKWARMYMARLCAAVLLHERSPAGEVSDGAAPFWRMLVLLATGYAHPPPVIYPCSVSTAIQQIFMTHVPITMAQGLGMTFCMCSLFLADIPLLWCHALIWLLPWFIHCNAGHLGGHLAIDRYSLASSWYPYLKTGLQIFANAQGPRALGMAVCIACALW